MDKNKGFNYKSNTNLHFSSKEHDVMEADLKTMASNVISNRLKSHNQLQNFYMPYLKKAFEDSRSTNPSLKSPQQLIFSSKLLEMKQTEDKLQIDLLKREIQSKNNRILKLENKVKVLEQNLLVFNKSPVTDLRIQQPYTNFKRMQEYMFIKNDEYLFRTKLRVKSLLQDFNIHKSDLQLVDMKRTDNQLLDYVLEKLKPISDDYRDLRSINYQRRNQIQNKHIRLSYENKQLEQSLELMVNNQRNLKHQLDHVKQNWNNSNTKIIYLEREVQQKDNQIYKLRKLLEQKHQNIKNINKQTQNKLSLETHLRIDNQKQANDMALLLQSSYVDNLELKEKLQQKQFEYEELKVAYQFNTQQLQRINRMNIKLKSRYEPEESNTSGLSYSPKIIHNDAFINKFNKVFSYDEKRLSDDYVTISKQKQITNQIANIRTINHKLPLQRIVQLRKSIDQKEHQLWRLQTKLSTNMVFSRENNPQIQKLQYEIQTMKSELHKLQSEISSRTKNI